MIRVLLVELHPDQYQWICELFAAADGDRYALEWTTSFEEAAAALARDTHDVYLVDCRLDDRTAADLLRGSGTRHGPVIVLAAHGDREIAHQVRDLGASEWLPKSCVTSGTLERSIRAALASSGPCPDNRSST